MVQMKQSCDLKDVYSQNYSLTENGHTNEQLKNPFITMLPLHPGDKLTLPACYLIQHH